MLVQAGAWSCKFLGVACWVVGGAARVFFGRHGLGDQLVGVVMKILSRTWSGWVVGGATSVVFCGRGLGIQFVGVVWWVVGGAASMFFEGMVWGITLRA